MGTWTAVSRETQIKSGGKTYAQAMIDSWGATSSEAAIHESVMLNAMTFAYTIYPAEMYVEADSTWRIGSSPQAVGGKWKLTSDEKTLTLTLDASSAQEMIAAVKRLNDTELWLEVKLDEDDYPFAPIPFDYTAEMKFTKKK